MLICCAIRHILFLILENITNIPNIQRLCKKWSIFAKSGRFLDLLTFIVYQYCYDTIENHFKKIPKNKKEAAEAAPSNIIFLNMEYCRKSSGEAFLLTGKSTEIQIKGHIALFPWPKGGADFAPYAGTADICPTDGHTISKA